MTRTKSTFLALIAVLLSPMAANAELIRVDYSGVIFNAGLTFAIDDIVSGSLIFDNSSAPSDSCPAADRGCYYDNTQFVSGGSLYNSTSGYSADQIYVEDIDQGTYKTRFFITDFERNANITQTSYTALDIYFLEDLLASTDLAQDFSSLNGGSINSISQITLFDTLQTDQLALARFTSLTFSTVSVPEPGTLALLGIGLFGMVAARRKKA